jgi:hypothetical protein
MGELLRVKEFAANANIRPATVRAWLLHRKISFVRLGSVPSEFPG